jgi:glycine oxidase
VSETFDVAVVGAGIVGLATARELARAGKRVVLLDRGEPGAEASWAAAGMLAPQIEAHVAGPALALGIAARERYAGLAAECEAAGHPIGLTSGGIARVAFDDDGARELQAQVEAQRALGLEAEWLSRKDLVWRHPGIAAGACGAALAPRDGCVDNVALCAALAADAQRHGVTFAVVEVVELMTAHGRAAGVRSALESHRAHVVVLAAGAWSGTIAGLPRPVPVAPVRGQMALAPWPAGEPRGVLFGRAGYVVARGDGAVLGSTMEHVGFDKHTTEEGLAHVRREAAALLPALASAMFTRTWAGLRPVTPDALPILGRDPDVEGLIYATGHGRNGILLGPLTGEIVRDLVVRGETEWDLAPYAIGRFG